MTSYRQVGKFLGCYFRSSSPGFKQLQGLLADLLAGDELLPPLRDLVSRPLFQSLLESSSGRTTNILQRDTLLQEMARSYLPEVVGAFAEVLDGILEQTPESDFRDQRVAQPSRQAPDQRKTGAFDEYSKGDSSAMLDPWHLNPEQTVNAHDNIDNVTSLEDSGAPKRLSPSQICDENLWNATRDPERDKAFLKAWNLRWFNKRYRPRLEAGDE